MIRELKITNVVNSLVPQTWGRIPDLAVISGLNGAGKSQLLNVIDDCLNNAGRLGSGARVSPSKNLTGRHKYIRPDFAPGDIHVDKKRSTVDQQLDESRARIIGMLRGQNNIDDMHRPLIEQLRKELGQSIDVLTDKELIDSFPPNLPLWIQDFFDNSYITETFRDYQHRIDQYKIDTYHSPEAHLSEQDIHEKIGASPPWLVINKLFSKYGFSYRISTPTTGVAYLPKFVDQKNPQLSLSFSQLSTGEKIIVTFILWAYNENQKNFSKIFLFDEIDAHLNPALSKMTMDIIRDKIVGEFGIQVIMTTHSPSTVARSFDEHLFWMERNQSIRPATRSEIIPILSDGIITIQPDRALRIFSQVIGEARKPILCVEGITDKKIIEFAWAALHPSMELPFEIHDVFDCYFLTNLFKRGRIFKNYPQQKFIGLIDFDDAYRDLKEKLSEKKENQVWSTTVNDKDSSVTYEHENKRGILTTLSVPEFRKDIAGPHLKGSALSIELLFENDVVEQYCKLEPVAGGGQILKFRDSKKTKFAEEVCSFGPDKFEAFVPLFDRLVKYASDS